MPTLDTAPAPAGPTDLIVLPPAALPADPIALRRPPAEVLHDAHLAAVALMQVINAKPTKVVFNGEQYIENEDWQTIGRFYGLTAQLESDRYISIGDASGWEATVTVTDVNGVVRARAASMCLNDEDNWRSRARYEWHLDLKDGTTSAEEPEDKGLIQWEPNPHKPGKNRPKRKRVHVGDEPVPLFQLRSMATTRAQSKALAMVLRFVPVLAGLRTTPVEELPHAERVPQGVGVEAEPTPGTGGIIAGGTGDPAPAPKPAPKATNGGGPRKLSEKQVAWLEREMAKHKVSPGEVLAYLTESGLPGVRAWSDVPMAYMDGLIAFVRGVHDAHDEVDDVPNGS